MRTAATASIADTSSDRTTIEGTLRCLERLRPERITARAIAEESGANLASIAYQVLLDPDLAIEGDRMQRAQARLRTILPP